MSKGNADFSEDETRDTDPEKKLSLEVEPTGSPTLTEANQTRIHFYLVYNTQDEKKKPLVQEHSITVMQPVVISALELCVLQEALGYDKERGMAFSWQTRIARFLAEMGINRPSQPPTYVMTNSAEQEYSTGESPLGQDIEYQGTFAALNLYTSSKIKSIERIAYLVSSPALQGTVVLPANMFHLRYVDVSLTTASERIVETAYRLWEKYVNVKTSAISSTECLAPLADHHRFGLKNNYLKK